MFNYFCTDLLLADGDEVLVEDPGDVLGVGLGGEGAGVGVVVALLQVGDDPADEVSLDLGLLGVSALDGGDSLDDSVEGRVPVALQTL